MPDRGPRGHPPRSSSWPSSPGASRSLSSTSRCWLELLHAVGLTPGTPYAMRPLPPLWVPQVISQSFWGGIWGIVFALVAPRFPRGAGYWATAVLFGAFALSLVAWFVVAPLKGLPVAGGGRPAAIATALLVNGAWGFGTALLLLAFRGMAGGGRAA